VEGNGGKIRLGSGAKHLAIYFDELEVEEYRLMEHSALKIHAGY
jgi:hypothetical protein